MLRLSVIKGPDKGKTQVFHSTRVTIGDDGRNDFELTDAMVSRFHGVFEVQDDHKRYVFRDLGSLNGSYIRCGSTNHRLHNRNVPQSVVLEGRAQLALGQTLIEVEIDPITVRVDTSTPHAPRSPEAADARNTVVGAPALQGSAPRLRESIVRRVNETPEHLAQRLSPTTDRLQVLFRLARELNALNRIEDILERVVSATFEMFPLANFFAIVVPGAQPDAPMQPLFVRAREDQPGTGVATAATLILSQSLLREVVERRESVLFVRDNLSADDSRKSIVMAQITACLAAPLFGQQRLMGVMQVDSRGRSGMFGYDDLDLFTVLASSAAFAMERAALTRNIYEMFEAFVQASVAAIDSRDPTTAGHSQRVADFTLLTAEAVNHATLPGLANVRFSPAELTELRYAALLHDFGKIGVREEVLQKASRLMPGTYQTLLQRLETARALEQQALMARYYQLLCDQGRAPQPQDLTEIEARGKAVHAHFNRYRDTVVALQGGCPLSDEQRAIVLEMREQRFTDAFGHSHDLLLEEEARDLLIPYGTLNADERRHIESHAGLSRDYLSRIPWSAELARIPCIAARHHEKLDGSGYPEGLSAPDIPHQVRILTITDIFDALTATDRPYKKARSVDDALGILHLEVSQGKLDGDLVQVFETAVVPGLRERIGRR